MAKDGLKEALTASAFVNKFAALIGFSDLDQYSLLPFCERLNIYNRSSFPDGSGREILRSVGADANAPVSLLRIGRSPISCLFSD